MADAVVVTDVGLPYWQEPPTPRDAAECIALLGTNMSEHAYLIGKTLTWVKKTLPHGEFMPWVAANVWFKQTTAKNFIRFARHCDKVAGLLEYQSSKSTDSVDPHVTHNTGENEWYTPPGIIDAARAAMGGIDCDPASCEFANRTVKADVFYTKEDDGLLQPWSERVWINPPYAQPLISQFAVALVSKVKTGEVKAACVLVNNATETEFFQHMLSVAYAVCFPKGRIQFLDTDGEATGSPLQGQAILYFGDDLDSFAQAFEKFGPILRTI